MHAQTHKRNPRLLLVTRSLDVGGTECHLAQIAPGLARRGFDVTLYCIARQGDHVGSISQAGVRVTGPRPMSRLLPGIHSAVTLMTGAIGLVPELLASRPDIAHFFLPHAFIAGSVAAAVTQVPVRIMSRRSQNLYQLKHPRIARLERRMQASMTAILGNSQRVVDELTGAEGVEPDRAGLIYNGIDLSHYALAGEKAAIRARLSLDPGTTVFSCVANLISYKGHCDLLQALSMIKDRLPRPWKMLAIGRDGGALEALQAQSAGLGLSDNIRWMGMRHDVPQLLAASDIGVLASHEEGFSNAILEGMASGLPMAVTDAGGNAEAVLDGVTGLVSPTRNPAQLAASLLELATNHQMAARMGEAGRARAHRFFGVETCLNAYEATYRALLAGERLPAGIAAARPQTRQFDAAPAFGGSSLTGPMVSLR